MESTAIVRAQYRARDTVRAHPVTSAVFTSCFLSLKALEETQIIAEFIRKPVRKTTAKNIVDIIKSLAILEYQASTVPKLLIILSICFRP
jgi:hypothetical protein